MPVLPLIHRSADTTVSFSSPSANNTTQALQVVCAWPVSGQYGPGSRVLYYVLVAVCVFARKADWLKKVCLAAALLFPAVAAIHGIVLAAVHVDGAVDMDVYGAFQLCSIGILAAPVTVRNSRTYFNARGRNTIFMWTGLVLSGLLSLTVEFSRIETQSCPQDDSGSPISSDAAAFPYSIGPKCGLTCSTGDGPVSPLRGGSANNIYVIPAPDHFTFGTAMLLAAACCVPAILSLVSTWNKILQINWNARFGDGDDNEQIEGTNGATIGKMKRVNRMVRGVLGAVEILVFGGAVIAIIIIGERNFFSSQVRYMTEPIASIGQWAPIVGTGLAAIGSLYLLLAKDVEEEANSYSNHSPEVAVELSSLSSNLLATPGATDIRPKSPSEPPPKNDRRQSQATTGGGHRRKVTNALIAFGNFFSAVAYDRFDDSDFRRGMARFYPQVPAEEFRNEALPKIMVKYSEDTTPPHREQQSRAGSFIGSSSSRLSVGDGSTTPRAASIQSLQSPQTPSSVQYTATPQRPGLHNATSSSCTGSAGDMLRVPSQVHHGSTWGK